jgi:hypothetical protein
LIPERCRTERGVRVSKPRVWELCGPTRRQKRRRGFTLFVRWKEPDTGLPYPHPAVYSFVR